MLGFVSFVQRYMQQHDEVELSGLGMGMASYHWQLLQFWFLCSTTVSKFMFP